MAEKYGDSEVEDKCREKIRTVFQSLGEYVKAKEYYETALAIAEKNGDWETEATCCERLGSVFQFVGEYIKAKQYYEKAVAIVEKNRNKRTEAACHGFLGVESQSIDGEDVKTKKDSEKFLTAAETFRDKKTEFTLHEKLGNIFESFGKAIKANECKNIEESRGYSLLGACFAVFGDSTTSKQYFDEALRLCRKKEDKESESFCHYLMSFSMAEEGNNAEAKSHFFAIIDKSEFIQHFFQDHDQLKVLLFESFVKNYRHLSHILCVCSDNLYLAFYVEEFGRARALVDLMLSQYSVKNEISANLQTWGDLEKIVMKERNCVWLFFSYYETFIKCWLLRANKPFLRLRMLNVPDGLFGKVSLVQGRSIKSALARPMMDEDEDPSLSTPLNTAYQILIAPIADFLDESEIVIVPDRHLFTVPFAALEDEEGRSLSESFRIRIVPSLTTLKLIRDSPTDYHSQTGALIVGDPHVGEVLYKGNLQHISRLSFANREAEMIGKLLRTQPLLGKEATKQMVLQRINSASLIHFACHGKAERGEIVLAPPPLTDRTPREEDYLLTMGDISKVPVRARLVVLSCCHSASGQICSEGVVGIARAFLGSGARSVLVTLWAIEDEAPQALMSRFYEHCARGENASESLRQAMKWMRENGWSKVSQWAPFMLIGDNVTLDFQKLRSGKK
ncbi:unnamed protein product [Porites evermanni]|uniref:CHAT domain-containing protein n=1 Tax=Porites evermanni TaxID=104178 RepID=A0ABN8M161_9CNID|nr:unnamed protein product [Porites evermanni]